MTDISDAELRAMVRSAISRGAGRDVQEREIDRPAEPSVAHASHRLLSLVAGSDLDGRCLIEPTVACTHCGYCQSMGY